MKPHCERALRLECEVFMLISDDKAPLIKTTGDALSQPNIIRVLNFCTPRDLGASYQRSDRATVGSVARAGVGTNLDEAVFDTVMAQQRGCTER